MEPKDARLASARLTVREKRAVVPLQDFFEHGGDDFMVDQGLICFWTKYEVEGVGLDGREREDTHAGYGCRCFDRYFMALRAARADDDGRVLCYLLL